MKFFKWRKRRAFRGTLNLSFPPGYGGLAHCDWSVLTHRARGWRNWRGNPVLQLPHPFEDVVLRDGEVLSVEKAQALYAAMQHFGVKMEVTHGGSQTSG